jgi:hypothetical protein
MFSRLRICEIKLKKLKSKTKCKMSLETQVSTSEDISTSESMNRSASLDLASLRTLEEIKEAFSELTKDEVSETNYYICEC